MSNFDKLMADPSTVTLATFVARNVQSANKAIKKHRVEKALEFFTKADGAIDYWIALNREALNELNTAEWFQALKAVNFNLLDDSIDALYDLRLHTDGPECGRGSFYFTNCLDQAAAEIRAQGYQPGLISRSVNDAHQLWFGQVADSGYLIKTFHQIYGANGQLETRKHESGVYNYARRFGINKANVYFMGTFL